MSEEGLPPTCKKLNIEGNVGVNVDRISNLPDNVVQRILSSLKIKDAVRTSLLSSSWRYRWMSVTNFHLSEWAPNTSPRRAWFLDFVDRVFELRKPSDLNLVAFAFKVYTDDSHINSWVCSAVKHNVKHLALLLDQIHEERLELPHCLFSCHTLRAIVIAAEVLLQLPSEIQFANLKILTLHDVIFPEDQSTQGLFSGLPLLQELTLDKCGWWNVNNITIALPLLQKLDITEDVEHPDNCRFHIIAKNLKSFCYIGALRNDYCIFDLESLAIGTLALCREDIEEGDRQRELAFRAHMFLRGISCVKQLILTTNAFEALTYSEELYACIPVLYKLKGLAFFQSGEAVNFGCGKLAKFLQKSPCLEFLMFHSGIYLSGNHEVGNWILDPVPSCFSSHLKVIQISQFCGTVGELLVVKSLLKSAEKLVELDITCLHDEFFGGSTRERSVLNELRMLPRASTYCRISFS